VISIPRIADIPIYIANSAIRSNGESLLVGGDARPSLPSKVDPLLVMVGWGFGCFVAMAISP
jgi:hypothetical protein